MPASAPLAFAHRGYEYQDLLVACRLVDLLLGNALAVSADEKLFDGDRFDDLTLELPGSRRERVQIKHTAADGRALSLETFTNDGRSLRLDRLFTSMLVDRDHPGREPSRTVFRVLTRDAGPSDPRLEDVLRPAAGHTFLPGLRSQLFRFDAQALAEAREVAGSPFAFLIDSERPISADELTWACDHLLIEVGAPRASLDLYEPEAAEDVLLERMRSDVGVGTFPNRDRSAVDVAAVLVAAARAARMQLLVLDARDLLRRTGLRSDFGAVSRSHPVDVNREVIRPTIVEDLASAAARTAAAGGHLVVEGPPGQGKSWVCKQLLDHLSSEGWLVAEHYCYLGDADGERLPRVLDERVFGSLMGRLAEEDPRLVQDQRPRFSADEDSLIDCIQRSLRYEPERKVALVVDGIDHVTRVLIDNDGAYDPSRSLAEALSALELPAGAVVVTLSQPGSHLAPLEGDDVTHTTLPGLTEGELRQLATGLGLVATKEGPGDTVIADDDGDGVDAFVTALVERSAGNALYATYLCREASRSLDSAPDPAAAVLALPSFDGTLASYYDYLYQSLGGEATWIADVLALADFPVGRAELREIRPDGAHRVDAALERLQPVLMETVGQGGVRIYHESFARYLRGSFSADPVAMGALLGLLTTWLEGVGFFEDGRSFLSLCRLLAEAGDDDRILELIDEQFVVNAVAAGFTASMINANLAVAVGAAARGSQWPTIVRCVEQSRAAESYSERYEQSVVEYVDVAAAVLGADTLAERLLANDRPIMAGRAGLQMCAALDALGATPPWAPYMRAYLREEENDNTSYGEESDRAVGLAWARGRLRLAATGCDLTAESPGEAGAPDLERGTTAALSRPVDWETFARAVRREALPLDEVIKAVVETHGSEGVLRLVRASEHPGQLCLEIAARLARAPELDPRMGSARRWALAAAAHEVPQGSVRRLLRLGLSPSEVAGTDASADRELLFELTAQVQDRANQFDESVSQAWLDAASLTAQRDELGLAAASALIGGEGWYPCWLRFGLELARCDGPSRTDPGAIALEALELLKGDLRPFVGEPRACDLYAQRGVIAETIGRALSLLDGDRWAKGLRLVREVGGRINTTMSGEQGGPIPPDLVLGLAVQGSEPERLAVAKDLIAEEIAEGSSGRFYSDLGEYRLLSARASLAAGDQEDAAALWREACVFLTAYGFHKDITIYELLDPLPRLIAADPQAGRARLAPLQALCERVPFHTDRRETRGAWSRWWALAAQADPVAVVDLAVRELLRHCNDPDWLHNGALEEVWRKWHTAGDPLITAALRLTIDSPLEKSDADQVTALAHSVAGDGASPRILDSLLARLDERAVSYSYSNSSEIVGRDSQMVADVNAAGAEHGASVVAPLDAFRPPPEERSQSRFLADRPTRPLPTTASGPLTTFPPGLPGLARAVRAWRRRRRPSSPGGVSAERFANVIGYRLLGLFEDGRSADAESVIRTLAQESGFEERAEMMRYLAEGLQRHQANELAALAYALTWTSSRGGGGWVNFGGETELDSLRRATELDPERASTLVAEEVQKAVATSRYGTYGISQALIIALAEGALPAPDAGAAAFAAWDQALTVIDGRAPRVDASDDPATPYEPPDADTGEPAPGDLNAAFFLATLGGLGAAGREKKRRSLLATRLLLEYRPAAAGPALAITLQALSDPATSTWLLRTLETSSFGEQRPEPYASVLRDLAGSHRLVVRTIARRLLNEDAVPPAPASTPETALLGRGRDPASTKEPATDENDPQGIARQVDAMAGARMRRAEPLLEGIRDAVHERAGRALRDEVLERRLRHQVDQLGDRVNERWPEAFLASDEAIEEALQTVAGNGRAALLMRGMPVTDPVRWEDELATAILDDPGVLIDLEAVRCPRPPIPPPFDATDPVWPQILEQADGIAAHGLISAEARGLLCATLAVDEVDVLAPVDGGAYAGWCWLGVIEHRSVDQGTYGDRERLKSVRYRGTEVRTPGDRQALTIPPFGEGNASLWKATGRPPPDIDWFEVSQPLLGLDSELEVAPNAAYGLGVPGPILTPLPALLGSLDLRAGEPFSYDDAQGPALALLTWRTEYDVSEHSLAEPRTTGAAVVIRPDRLEDLKTLAGSDRVVLRDLVIGDRRFAPDPAGEDPTS